MGNSELAARIQLRAEGSGTESPSAVVEQCAAYLGLLAKWNRKINLTAFDLDPPTSEAIDRLIVEPLSAARHIHPSDELMIDIGSGGGSPALPIKIAAPWLRMTLVESKTRKAAFLSEAARQLALTEIAVDIRRADELTTNESFDLVTVRAVRLDDQLAETIAGLLRAGGRVFWFRAEREPAAVFPPAWTTEDRPLSLGSVLTILTKT